MAQAPDFQSPGSAAARGELGGRRPATPDSRLSLPVMPFIPEDPGLPGLSILLDVDRLAPLLKEEGLINGRSGLRIEYVRYKPGTNCLVFYRELDSRGRRHFFHAKAYAPGLVPRPGRSLSHCRWLPDLRLLWVPFPVDLRLPALQRAFSPTGGQQVLDRLISERRRERFRPDWQKWTLVRYKPERRCLLKGSYTDGFHPSGPGRGYYLRFYGSAKSSLLASWYRHFSGENSFGVKIPRLITFSKGLRVLLVKESGGTPLLRLLEGSDESLEDVLAAAAQALHRLHCSTSPAGVKAWTFRDPGESLFSSQLDHWLGLRESGLAELWHRVMALRPKPLSRPSLLHGDFYHDQILVKSGPEIRLLDLDNLSLGDPCVDVANFCAHLELLAVLGTISVSNSQRIAGAFVSAYQDAAGYRLRRDRLSWNLAVALLRLVPWPFRLFRNRWPDLTRCLLDGARDAVEGSK